MVVHGRPKTPKIQVFWGSPSPQGSYSPYILGDTTRPGHVTCVSLIQIGSKTAEKNFAQTNRQTNRHYENIGHLAVNQYLIVDSWSVKMSTLGLTSFLCWHFICGTSNYHVAFTVTCDQCAVTLLLGCVYEKAYDIPSHLRGSSFFVAVCLKVGLSISVVYLSCTVMYSTCDALSVKRQRSAIWDIFRSTVICFLDRLQGQLLLLLTIQFSQVTLNWIVNNRSGCPCGQFETKI